MTYFIPKAWLGVAKRRWAPPVARGAHLREVRRVSAAARSAAGGDAIESRRRHGPALALAGVLALARVGGGLAGALALAGVDTLALQLRRTCVRATRGLRTGDGDQSAG